jgi:ATP-dependent DNA helicase PIF1
VKTIQIAEFGVYPVEFLNTLQLSGLPPHDLQNKTGQFVVIFSNLNPSRGLLNRNMIQFLNTSRVLSRFKLIEGKYTGEELLIARITLCCHDLRLSFNLCRRRFPVLGSFPMSVLTWTA